MDALKALAFVFLAAGFVIVMGAKAIVNKYQLADRTHCDFENEMSEEELSQYKYNKAVVNVKMFGMAVFLPGIVLILVLFR